MQRAPDRCQGRNRSGHLGAQGQTRTADRTIFSRELYQLSYLSLHRLNYSINESRISVPSGRCGPVGDRGLEPLTSTV